ncbi:hypothetical protein ABW19_dt0207126 [Dactylella cylindrospora]|nr:hypothetical protein ABW19_dt0207126 [Dactylella cylindrospora]
MGCFGEVFLVCFGPSATRAVNKQRGLAVNLSINNLISASHGVPFNEYAGGLILDYTLERSNTRVRWFYGTSFEMDAGSKTAKRKRTVATYSKKSRTYLNHDGHDDKRRRLSTSDHDEYINNDTAKNLQLNPSNHSTAPSNEDANDSQEDDIITPDTDNPSSPIRSGISSKSVSKTTNMKSSSSSFTLSTRRKPLFKRTSAKSTSSNNTSRPSAFQKSLQSQPPPQKQLVQMQIDLDGIGAPKITCKECGMSYVPSAAEDAKLHKRYHGRVVEGLEFGNPRAESIVWQGTMKVSKSKAACTISKAAVKAGTVGEKENSTPMQITKYFAFGRGEKTAKRLPLMEQQNKVLASASNSTSTCHVVEITRRSNPTERKKAAEFLKFANQELSAQDVPERVLWGSNANSTGEMDSKVTGGDGFKIYLYLEGSKCIGLCLAEKITQAQWATPKEEGKTDSGSISCSLNISPTKRPALVGISRIWTNPKYRRSGVASRLVTTVAESFVYGMKLSAGQIAFSQPTDSGACFALEWVAENGEKKDKGRQEEGFMVYFDSV